MSERPWTGKGSPIRGRHPKRNGKDYDSSARQRPSAISGPFFSPSPRTLQDSSRPHGYSHQSMEDATKEWYQQLPGPGTGSFYDDHGYDRFWHGDSPPSRHPVKRNINSRHKSPPSNPQGDHRHHHFPFQDHMVQEAYPAVQRPFQDRKVQEDYLTVQRHPPFPFQDRMVTEDSLVEQQPHRFPFQDPMFHKDFMVYRSPCFPFHDPTVHEDYGYDRRTQGFYGEFPRPDEYPNFQESPPEMGEVFESTVGPRLNLYPPTNRERYELFERAWMCGETPDSRPYLALYWLQFQEEDSDLQSPLFENDRNDHAEAHLLKHLQLLLSVINRSQLKSITIMQNASPCWRCSKRYTKELEGLRTDNKVEVTIVFSSFHWVRRASCRSQGHKHQHVTIEKHDQNTQGLKDLRNAGFTVRTTCYEDWRSLSKALQLPMPVYKSTEANYRLSPRGQADEHMREDLDKLIL